MIEEIRAVMVFEYRRYMRARVFWLLLLGSTAIGLIGALAFYVGNEYVSDALTMSLLLLATLVGLGALILIQVLSLGDALFDDAVDGRALPDLWLTGMSPLSLILGRWLFAGFYTLLTLVAVAPALWLGARAGGVSLMMLMGTLLLFWLSVMRLLPEMFLVKIRGRRAQLLGWTDSEVVGEGAAGFLLALSLAVFYFWQAVLGGISLPPAMPVLLFSPPLVMLEAHRAVSLGGLTLPMSWLGSVFLLGFALLGLLAALRAADARLLWARFWQPLLGSVLLLTLWGISLYAYAAERVHAPLQAQATALSSLWLGWTLYAFFQNELAFFALWRGEPVQSAAHPTGRGALWLTTLWMSMGVSAPLIIAAASGVQLEPTRWGMILLVLACWCAFASSLVFSRDPLQNDALNRNTLPALRHAAIGTVLLGGLVWGVLAARWIVGIIPFPWLANVAHTLLYLAPSYWVFLPDAPLWVYGVYALYNAALALVMLYRRVMLGISIR